MILIIIATIASIGNGAFRPASFVIFGQLIEKFVEFGKNETKVTETIVQFFINETKYNVTSINGTNVNQTYFETTQRNRTDQISSKLNIEDEMKKFAVYYIILAAGMFVCSFLQAGLWSITAVRQVHRIRIKFFQSILKQDVGWFDVNEGGGLTTRLSEYVLVLCFCMFCN